MDKNPIPQKLYIYPSDVEMQQYSVKRSRVISLMIQCMVYQCCKSHYILADVR
jgi:hypothetical protein